MILQFGKYPIVGHNGYASVTFPITFKINKYSLCNCTIGTEDGNYGTGVHLAERSLSDCRLYNDGVQDNGGCFIVIGS